MFAVEILALALPSNEIFIHFPEEIGQIRSHFLQNKKLEHIEVEFVGYFFNSFRKKALLYLNNFFLRGLPFYRLALT
jgi:hypothetical protein